MATPTAPHVKRKRRSLISKRNSEKNGRYMKNAALLCAFDALHHSSLTDLILNIWMAEKYADSVPYPVPSFTIQIGMRGGSWDYGCNDTTLTYMYHCCWTMSYHSGSWSVPILSLQSASLIHGEASGPCSVHSFLAWARSLSRACMWPPICNNAGGSL